MSETQQLELAARWTDRIWDSPLGEILQDLPEELSVKIVTDLIVGMLKDVTA